MTHLPRRWSHLAAISLAALLAVGVAARAEEHPEHEGARGGHPEAGHPAQGHPAQGHPAQGHPAQGHPEAGHPAPGHVEQGRPAPGRVESHAPGPHAAGRVEPGHFDAGHRAVERERFVFHERDVHRFRHEDLVRWRGGRWRQTCDFGRCGWWWFAGGMWYFYDRPIYPYPLVVGEITYVEPMPVAPPPVVVVPAPPPPPVVQAAPQFWYWCDNPQGYYPYVQACSVEFRQVPVPVNNGPPQ